MQKRLLFIAFIITFISSVFTQTKPNVIVILTDDQGTVDLNCYGAKDLYTPNIDALAKAGTRFTQFYVAAPVCSPSRASMLTGLNPHAAGLPGNTSSQKGHAGMPTDRTTIAETMKEAGYATAHIGKWHLGYTPETMPRGQGFDYSFGHMGGCIDNYSHFFYWNGPNRHDLWENETEIWEDGKYFPDLMVEKAKAFIKDHREEPFFMYYAINLPHYPLQPTKKWRDHYADLARPRQDYAAFVSTIDERIGNLVNTLKDLKIRENTIIIFQSDHGHSMETRTFGQGGSSGPFRGAKFSLFEGGIRVPSIISWPGNIPQDAIRHQMAFNIDWFATIADYCGIKTPPLEGKSLVPLIDNNAQASPHKLFRWKNGVSWAVRKGDWKLLGYPNDPSNKGQFDPDKDLLFLTNLKMDSTEMTNLAAKYPEKVEELINDYLDWEYGEQEHLPQKREEMPNKAFAKSIKLEKNPHKKYSIGGANALIDKKLGSRLYSDGYWQGFNGTDLNATIDLGAIEHFQSVTIGCLQDAATWILFPEYVEVSWSKDGKTFSKPIKKQVKELKDNERKSIIRVRIEQENIHARYIMVKAKNVGKCPDWHNAKGGKAWLFVDEISVE